MEKVREGLIVNQEIPDFHTCQVTRKPFFRNSKQIETQRGYVSITASNMFSYHALSPLKAIIWMELGE